MTNEQEQLLIKDLCARLPYGVKIHIKPSLETGEDGVDDQILEAVDLGYNVFNAYSVMPTDVKPYLRPMTSMTSEEKEEYAFLLYDCGIGIKGITHCTDWLNAHHFDYRGLIEKGLALEAPKGMYEL